MMKAIVALALMSTVAFAGAATAGPVLDRIHLKKMTDRWFKDGSWLKELP